MKYIDFIADYGKITGHDDLAFSEVCGKLCAEFKERGLDFPLIKCLSVRPFNTVETGFVVAQLALNSKLGKAHIVYHNTAPRKDALNARSKNEGEFLAVAELPSGVRVIGVFGGYTFSFIKEVAKVYRVKCARDGSQFRSRDVFPPCVADLAAWEGSLADWPLLGEEVNDVPQMPENIILSIDGYGNIKTNLKEIENKKLVTLNGIAQQAAIGDGIFSVPDGCLIVAPGSSGFNGEKFAEICLRGGSAATLFGNPVPGDKIHLD